MDLQPLVLVVEVVVHLVMEDLMVEHQVDLVVEEQEVLLVVMHLADLVTQVVEEVEVPIQTEVEHQVDLVLSLLLINNYLKVHH